MPRARPSRHRLLRGAPLNEGGKYAATGCLIFCEIRGKTLSPISTAMIAFVLITVGALAGMGLRRVLPDHHLSGDSKDVIKLATALVGTMTTLVLALLFASTRQSFEHNSASVSRMTSDLKQLDKVLAEFGPDGVPMRAALRDEIRPMIDSIWKENAAGRQVVELPMEKTADYMLRQFSPQGPAQRSLQARALQLANDLSETQASLSSQPTDTTSHPFIFAVVLWLIFIFAVFNMYSQPNVTLTVVMFFCILSASGAIYLILELGLPFGGLMQVDSESLRKALN